VHSPLEMSEEPRREARHDSTAALLACDMCGSARSPSERHRILWATGADEELVLAELCGRCAADGERLLDRYGGRGRVALRVNTEAPVEPVRSARQPRAARVLVYLLVALASFIIVTLISSLR
jgi:hypothetical protein